MKLETRPCDEGYRLTADFERQSASYIIWPERPDNWRDGAKPAQQTFAKLAEMIAEVQPVTMLVNEDQQKNARSMLSERVRVVEMRRTDAWMKDYGPFFVKNKDGLVRAVSFNFNAWGGLIDGLYFPWDKDIEVASKICDLDGIDYYDSSVIIEGCALHTDGQGTIITTEDVLLSEDRNPAMTKEKMESILKEYLGAKKIIWIKHGYFMDETGGDIDNLLNFTAPGRLVLNWTDDQNHVMYETCRDIERVLKNSSDANGQKFELIRLPLPKKELRLTEQEAETVDYVNGLMPRDQGQLLTATYVNYVTVNGMVIVPEFNDENDALAKRILQNEYPNRKIVGLPAREVLNGGGGLHTIVDNRPE